MSDAPFSEFTAGSIVQHLAFGRGKVLEVSASRIRVEYESGELGCYEERLWHVYSRYLSLVRRAA